ncbi:MAG: LacI family DNA-binding transcriptional regulator [Planctomycetales bacterium]|nr:LacI family DNA-binding transcriptional regulator [Planctomycetales bacterium]
MSATIYDIARQAGVSSSTVARVLRGSTRGARRDSAERADRIRKIASDLGYRPNVRARSFSEQRTKGVGLLYDNDAWIFEGINDKVVQGLVRELRESGHHSLLVPIDDGGEWEEVVLGGHVDGCVAFHRLPEQVRQRIDEANLPCVMLGDDSDPALPQILVDDFGGGYAAARHLIGLGHRSIGLYVHANVKPHCSIGERRRGVEAALTEAGLQPRFWHCAESELISSVLRGADRPTALICYSDLESTYVINALWQYGLRAPEDLSVVGFNDKFATKFMAPPLTTIGFDAAGIGKLGAQLVLQSLAADGEEFEVDESSHVINPHATNGEASKIYRVKTQLIVRASTAAPKAERGQTL